jgi:hypothetical protein
LFLPLKKDGKSNRNETQPSRKKRHTKIKKDDERKGGGRLEEEGKVRTNRSETEGERKGLPTR